ncbi:hypothetical protein [Desulfovibrio litoralis]|uniref:Uncharacterized protein n=1 Tax=Desulfovibrio litoralis DSM 11393 TaxID=1121455 RepID=A0A1M7TPK5_9BACT|nr:hypothetical protein [Desulfovibrio litoralis]SHN72588.1 hypothetical protein SAMN02745728_02325 [Desulfovibrio litoralis DSM 11393]
MKTILQFVFIATIVFIANIANAVQVNEPEVNPMTDTPYRTVVGDIMPFKNGIELIDPDYSEVGFTFYFGNKADEKELAKVMAICGDKRLPKGTCEVTIKKGKKENWDDAIVISVIYHQQPAKK